MKTGISILFLLHVVCLASAQGSYSPQAGEEGSDAIPADSELFRDWAISCDVDRGLRQVDMPDSGYATAGAAVYATGRAEKVQVVSLGDGGTATLMFSAPIYDGEGADFAVFENGFGFGADAFLELAFVEVSSNGSDYFRFPAVTEISALEQKGTFENSDATYLHNLAGKYIAGYGVPFDLAELPDTSLLDKQNVTHVRIVDVIGNVDSAYAQLDSDGNIINDPWPTNFPQSGFDLDAVGVIHSKIPLGLNEVSGKDRTNPNVSFDLLGRPINELNQDRPYISVSAGTKRLVHPRQ